MEKLLIFNNSNKDLTRDLILLSPRSCLRSWLEHDTSCPTCRLSLGPTQPTTPEAAAPRPRYEEKSSARVGFGAPLGLRGDIFLCKPPNMPGQLWKTWLNCFQKESSFSIIIHFSTRNRSWQFRGSRWASWLPNFSHTLHTPFTHPSLTFTHPSHTPHHQEP